MSDLLNPNKVVVFTGYELSKNCGTPNHRNIQSRGKPRSFSNPFSPYAWQTAPAQVIATFNEFKQAVQELTVSQAYQAIAKLEEQYDVTVITQNIDDLHERAGSSDVRHLHGDMQTAISTVDPNQLYRIDNSLLSFDPNSPLQLRPNIVSYGERTYWQAEARALISSATLILAVGVSFDLLPSIHLLRHADQRSERHFVSERDQKRLLQGYRIYKEPCDDAVKRLVSRWLS